MGINIMGNVHTSYVRSLAHFLTINKSKFKKENVISTPKVTVVTIFLSSTAADWSCLLWVFIEKQLHGVCLLVLGCRV